ncbi:hypothetical protein [Flavobacterium sp.]|jgi:DNA modification methylase|uniref:hypothetical protein n=1 Tax=Flavobacterium sp. TaxID=239 RepID=UPI0037BEAA33
MNSEKLKQHIDSSKTIKYDVTFKDAKYQSIHRWFPYLEGFSETFIVDILKHIKIPIQTIYEPFAGSGTLPVYCILNGYDVYYSEVNSFLQDLINLKIDVLKLDDKNKNLLILNLESLTNTLIESVNECEISEDLKKTYVDTFGDSIYFQEVNYQLVLRFRTFIDNQKSELVKKVLETSACEALLHSSLLKRNGDIRYRKGKELEKITNFLERCQINLNKITDDLKSFNKLESNSFYKFTPNAKHFDPAIENKIDVIITSPPYLNGTNYIRNTKLELWFLRYLKSKSDLSSYRRLVVTAGINDVSRENKEILLPSLEHLLKDPKIWYDKRIPKMVNDYFFDMKVVLENSYKYLKTGGYIFIDIGDSIYGGIHIPTDEILIDLCKLIGFKFKENIKLRERKSKDGSIVKQTLIIAEKI